MKRSIIPLNENWSMQKGDEPAVMVDLPHCANALDGQDGSRMYRGKVVYTKNWNLSEEEARRTHYLEIGAASLSSEVRINGTLCHQSSCGYAMYRVPMDAHLKPGENTIEITVSNALNSSIYPAMADFSFYNGLYRDVCIVCDPAVHFHETDGSKDGIVLIPAVNEDGSGTLQIIASIQKEPGFEGEVICKAELLDDQGRAAAFEETTSAQTASFSLNIPDVHLWDGLADPYLYTAVVTLSDARGHVYDQRRIPTGFRTISWTPESGLLLNGRPCKLHGVARHQDFGGLGNAIRLEQLQRDLDLILETGANSVRCSHYQHCDQWYELCDRAGLLVWAEIPVISCVVQKEAADRNAMEHLEHLIAQVRNHCSVYCWGVQNEVCMVSSNPYTFDLVRRLSERARELDPARLIAQANEYTTEDDSPILQHTDILGYNLYYGWYYGQIEDLQTRLDQIHAANPEKPVILTEYGVDTNPQYHSLTPQANDYSEEYQLKFLANALQAVEERPWMAGGYAWNMFDFGSAGRDEGGKKGQNQKGLVTIDRQLKKDAFYLYKASWSQEPFVYLAGRRFVNRPQKQTGITVLSNMERVQLEVNGILLSEKPVEKAVTLFENVPLQPGENRIRVIAYDKNGGIQEDAMTVCRVEQEDESYKAPVKTDAGNAVNWFEGLDPATMEKVEKKPLRNEGFTFEDSVQELFDHPKARAVFMKYFSPIAENPRFEGCMSVSVRRLLGFVKQMNIPEAVQIQCEQELNAIDK